jgi:hypothetical protein
MLCESSKEERKRNMFQGQKLLGTPKCHQGYKTKVVIDRLMLPQDSVLMKVWLNVKVSGTMVIKHAKQTMMKQQVSVATEKAESEGGNNKNWNVTSST